MTKNKKSEKNNDKLFIQPVLQADLCMDSVITEKAEFDGVEDVYIVAVTMIILMRFAIFIMRYIKN